MCISDVFPVALTNLFNNLVPCTATISFNEGPKFSKLSNSYEFRIRPWITHALMHKILCIDVESLHGLGSFFVASTRTILIFYIIYSFQSKLKPFFTK